MIVFRGFIRNLDGCGWIMTEFTSADGVLRKKDQKAKRYSISMNTRFHLGAAFWQRPASDGRGRRAWSKGSVSILAIETWDVPRKKL